MASRPDRVCACGHRVPGGTLCECQRRKKAEADKRRPSARQRGYDTAWQKESRAFLGRNPTCKMCCAPSVVVDHIKPHRGNRTLFWDRSNWQALCRRCHSSAKQRMEAKGRGDRKFADDEAGPVRGGSRGRDLKSAKIFRGEK